MEEEAAVCVWMVPLGACDGGLGFERASRGAWPRRVISLDNLSLGASASAVAPPLIDCTSGGEAPTGGDAAGCFVLEKKAAGLLSALGILEAWTKKNPFHKMQPFSS